MGYPKPTHPMNPKPFLEGEKANADEKQRKREVVQLEKEADKHFVDHLVTHENALQKQKDEWKHHDSLNLKHNLEQQMYDNWNHRAQDGREQYYSGVHMVSNLVDH